MPHRASDKRVSLLSASKYTGQGPRTLIIEKIIVENIPANLLGRCKPYLIVNVGDNEQQTKLLATMGGEDPVGKNMRLIGFDESLPCDKPAVWNQHMEFEFDKGGKDIIMTVRVMEETSNAYKKNVAVGVFPSIRDEGTGVATFMLRDFSHGLKERKAVLVKDAIPVKGPDGFTSQVRVMARVPAVPEDGPFGIGINFVKRDGDLVVDTLAPNYIHLDGIEPKQGDKVISIDRTSVEGLTFAKIISLTTGELGSPVELEFERITEAVKAPPVSQYLQDRSSSEVAHTLYPTISVVATKAAPEQDLEKLKSDIAEFKKEAQKAHLAGDADPISLDHIELLETQLAEEIKRKVELAEAKSNIAQLKEATLLNTGGPISLEHIENAEDKLAEQIKSQAKLVEEVQRQAEEEVVVLPPSSPLAQNKLWLRESRAARIPLEEEEQEAVKIRAEEEATTLSVRRLMRSVSSKKNGGGELYFLDSDGKSDDFYANAYYKLGAKAHQHGDTVRAAKLFEEALRSNPSYKELLKVRVARAALDVVEPDFLTDGALTDQELLEMAGVLEPPEVNTPNHH
jgi:tetratricopeptide (TPR) repeat protein